MSRTHGERLPSWKEVKAKLAGYDRSALLDLVHELYGAQKDNRTFLHARLGLGEDALAPYKATIDRWMWPDVLRGQDASVTKAKQAIASYKKAVGDPRGLAELMIFFCEQGSGFSASVGYDDVSFLNALWRVFESALQVIAGLPKAEHDQFLERLDDVRLTSHDFGYGIGDRMDELIEEYENRR